MRGQNKDKITETSFWKNFPNKWPQVLDNETNEIASQKKIFFFDKKNIFSTHNLSLSKHVKYIKHFVASQYASTLFCTYHTRKTSQTLKRLSFTIQILYKQFCDNQTHAYTWYQKGINFALEIIFPWIEQTFWILCTHDIQANIFGNGRLDKL